MGGVHARPAAGVAEPGRLPAAGRSSPTAPYGLATFQYTPAPP